MAKPEPAYSSWPPERLEEFRRDYAAGMKGRELSAKYGICQGTVWRTARDLGLIGTRETCCTMLISREMDAFITGIYPDHSNREVCRLVEERFGVTLNEDTLKSFAMRRGITKSERQKKVNDARKTEVMQQAWAEKKDEIVARRAASLKRTVASERRRALHGLPQRTKIEIQISPNAKRRQRTKAQLCWVNNYFSDGRGSRRMYYDEQTKRSRLMEEKYGDMFEFLPADGFDEKDSVFTKKINWKRSS